MAAPRRLFRWSLLILLAGFAASLATTWGLALARPQSSRGAPVRQGVLPGESPWWHLRRTDSPGMTRLYWTAVASPPPAAPPPSLVPDWSHVARRGPAPEQVDSPDLLVEVGFGWPFVAASYQYQRLGRSWSDPHTPALGALDVGTARRRTRLEVLALPLRPAWGGIAANTVMFAGAIAALIVMVELVHRRVYLRAHRRRAGLCASCGYDLRGRASAMCPECGDAVVPDHRALRPPPTA